MKEQFEKQEAGEEDIMEGLDDETKKLLKLHISLAAPIESKVRHMLDEETEQEDADMLERIMADIEEFKQMTEKSDAQVVEANGVDPLRNVKLIEEIMIEQEKYNK